MSQNQSTALVHLSRAEAELELTCAVLDMRNQQLHQTEQQLSQSEQQLNTKVRGYRQVLSVAVGALFVLIAILVMGGAA